MTTQRVVGSIVSLWRYPVKSMMGEELNATEVAKMGLLGDRAYALVSNGCRRCSFLVLCLSLASCGGSGSSTFGGPQPQTGGRLAITVSGLPSGAPAGFVPGSI
jgi:hypothetical protein